MNKINISVSIADLLIEPLIILHLNTVIDREQSAMRTTTTRKSEVKSITVLPAKHFV